MCTVYEQILNLARSNVAVLVMVCALLGAGPALAGPSGSPGSIGSVALGDAEGGVTDRAYVMAPPNFIYVVERERGSFLDCGEGMDARNTDSAGRDLAGLSCGVTLTETIVIPAASSSARLIIHY